MQYFIINSNGGQAGPYTLQELAKQQLSKNTMVWRKGMSNWQEAGSLPELAAVLPAMPASADMLPTGRGDNSAMSALKIIGIVVLAIAAGVAIIWGIVNIVGFFNHTPTKSAVVWTAFVPIAAGIFVLKQIVFGDD